MLNKTAQPHRTNRTRTWWGGRRDQLDVTNVSSVTDHLLGVLTKAMKRRPATPGTTKDSDGKMVPAWVLRERAVMHGEVNMLRSHAGKPPVPVEAIKKIDDSVAGHFDYTSKYALRCAQLVTL